MRVLLVALGVLLASSGAPDETVLIVTDVANGDRMLGAVAASATGCHELASALNAYMPPKLYAHRCLTASDAAFLSDADLNAFESDQVKLRYRDARTGEYTFVANVAELGFCNITVKALRIRSSRLRAWSCEARSVRS